LLVVKDIEKEEIEKVLAGDWSQKKYIRYDM